PQASGKLQQLIHLYQQGNLQAARHLAEQFLHSQPKDPSLIEISAVIALQQGDTERAITLFRQQLTLQPGNAIAHSNICMALHSQGQDEEAFLHGKQAISLDPRLGDAWNNLGNIYKDGNKLVEALQHYQKALALDNSDPRVQVNAGSVCQLLGNLETAEQHYRAAIAIQPAFVSAWNNLATTLQRQQRREEAEKAYRHALALQPANAEALTNYGTFLQEHGDTDAARDHFRKAIESDPGYVGAYIGMGNLCDRLHDRDGVRKYYDKVLLLDPNNSTVHCNLGYRLYETGHQKDSLEHFRRALKSNPHSPKALAGLGKALLRQGDEAAAAENIERALELASWDIHAHIARAHLYKEQHRHDDARTEWQYVIDRQPDICDGYIGLASHYASLGDMEACRETYHAAEERNAANLHLYHAWSQQEEKANNLDAAERLAAKAVALDANYPGLIILRAKLARRRKDYSGALALLQQIDCDAIESNLIKSGYLFELGNNLDKLARYAEAFAAYDTANQAKNEYIGRVYDTGEDRQQFQQWSAFFTAENMQRLRELAIPPGQGPTPVFIVGFPRSGTSLLEQILGSHPQIAPCGELLFIGDLNSRKAAEVVGSHLSYPDLLLDNAAPLTTEKLRAMQQYYLSGVGSLGVTDADTRWVTDKMPHNAIDLGLIALLFPDSPIIHISRHPFNSCLSAYFSNFDSGHRYTSSLESTAQHYKQMMDMLLHYRSIGLEFLEVHYEDLVQDQEAVTRQILEYIGAPWDDACLQHHKSNRVVKTASYEQVTQKIYTSSLYRYRNYHEAVKPLVPILESTLRQFGYTAE
ncbi:MAG TPA: tetratricopeptide repeat protein, partial [Gammaproteobacteria bacterium]|nr:tetratricopeptide repeat protein [Gammaproteobacteria bacterium]